MPTIDIHEAESVLSRLVKALETGAEREVIIMRDGRGVAKLLPMPAVFSGPRIGVAEGKFAHPEDLDQANPAIAAMFGMAKRP